MIVQEKTREIGIVRSMGATAGGVWCIFVTYALVIGIVGSAMGTTVGVLFVRYINEFQDFIAEVISPELRVWSPENYAFDRIPNIVKPFDAAVIVGIAIFACVIGSLVAARKAANIWPVDAIRYE
jgi:lipoprotein-releasing system permease protein